ncbi:Putative terpenoid synthase 16 [Linum perenne]
MYEQDVGHDQTLLKLAKLSWNVLQHLYQQELKDVTKYVRMFYLFHACMHESESRNFGLLVL